jgi:DNA repair protein RadC
MPDPSVLALDPDTRMSLVGPSALGDAELLSFLLTRGGPPGLGALDLARRVLSAVGGAQALPRSTEGSLQSVAGIGPARARRLLAAVFFAERMHERRVARGDRISAPSEVYEVLRGRARRATQEHFWVIALDARSRRLSMEEVARGGRSQVHVDVAQVFRTPLIEGADAVLVAHNHPSGDPAPSPQDLALTKRLAAAGELLGIDVLDHVIVGHDSWASLRELGYLPLEPVGFSAPGDEAAQ